MIYRQSTYMSDDLDARARLLELASEGNTIRSAAAQRRALAHKRAEDAKAKWKLECERKQQRSEMRAANLRRMIATSRLHGLLSWEWSLYMFAVVLVLILSLMPVWILFAELGPLGFGTLAVIALLPLAVTYSMRAIAQQFVRKERRWLDSRDLEIEGHWQTLGARTTHVNAALEFAGEAPDAELIANVIAAIATQVSRKTARLLSQTGVPLVESGSLTLPHQGLAHPCDYLRWSHALVDRVAPELAKVYPLRTITFAPPT